MSLACFEALSLAAEPERKAKKIANLKKVVKRLPELEYIVFGHIIKVLYRVMKHKSRTMMDAQSLASVWGPLVLRPDGFASGRMSNQPAIDLISVVSTALSCTLL